MRTRILSWTLDALEGFRLSLCDLYIPIASFIEKARPPDVSTLAT